MKLFKMAKSGAALLACSIAAYPVMAEDDLDTGIDKAKGGGFVGLGVAYKPDYEGGDDYEASIAPFGAYVWGSGRSIKLGGTSGSERAARISFDALTRDTAWQFGPVLQYRMERDDVDNSKVDRMRDIDAATELGAFLGWQGERLNLSTTFASDVSDELDGYLWFVVVLYKFPLFEFFTMSVGAHVTWACVDYLDTYLGVIGCDAAWCGL